MSKFTTVAVATVFGLGAAMPLVAGSEARIHPYATSEDYCPSGLVPVTFDGAISCGTPNQTISYQAIKVHPAARKKTHRVAHRPFSGRADCPIGTKGCTFD